MDLSLILCTRNNGRRLRITLGSISHCRIPADLHWEMVLVNHNCTDDTDEIVRDFSGKLPLLYIHELRQGLSHARNAGLKAASGDLILFTDDDVIPGPRWVTSYWTAYQEKPKGFFFGGPVESEFEGEKPDKELLPLAPYSVKGLSWGQEARFLTRNEYFIGSNWACPLDALRATGGFDTRLGPDPSSSMIRAGEETDLMQRLKQNGLSAWYIPQARIVHFVPVSKTTLKHISARWDASGYRLGIQKGKTYAQLPGIGRIPLRAYGNLFKHCLQWVYARSTGKKGYRECRDLRYAVGFIKALRDAQCSTTNNIKKTKV